MSNEETKKTREVLSRIKKVSRVIKAILNTVFVLLIIAIIALVASFVVASLFPDLLSASILGGGPVLLPAALSMVIVATIVKIISDVFSDITKGESPFSMTQVKRLRWIAALLLADIVISLFVVPVISPIMQFSDAALLGVTNSASYGPTTIARINLGEIVVAIAVYCASLVFQYGVLLQRYSDETL